MRYELDTAALLFPAIARRKSCDISRTSMTLSEPVDAALLQQALDDMHTHFPTFFTALRHNLFEYYLESVAAPLRVKPDGATPLAPMSRREAETACMRVLYGHDLIAVELYHVICDGKGALTFLCSLVARYLELRHGVIIPREGLALDCATAPSAQELEDGFLRHAAPVGAAPHEPHVYLLHGDTEPRGTSHITTGIASTQEVLDAAHAHGVSVTSLLVAAMTQTILEIQRDDAPHKRRKPVHLRVPVDLRALFDSPTLRNFSLVVNLGVTARSEPYRFDELCTTIQKQMRERVTPKNMAAIMGAAVHLRKSLAYKMAPLCIKNAVAKVVYELMGERCGCMTISNFGVVKLPKPMGAHVKRVDTMSGPPRIVPHICGIVSYEGRTHISITRVLREPALEERLFAHLGELGIDLDITCDGRPLNSAGTS